MAVATYYERSYISTTNSKTTKDIQEIFPLLDEPINSKQPCIILVEGSPGFGKCFLLNNLFMGK